MNPTIIIGYRVFAEMRATRLVKDDIKRKGHKWSQYSAAEKKTMITNVLGATSCCRATQAQAGPGADAAGPWGSPIRRHAGLWSG